MNLRSVLTLALLAGACAGASAQIQERTLRFGHVVQPGHPIWAIKEFTLLDIPFSFTRAEQVDALVAGPFGQALLARLPEKGMVGLAFWETGFRNKGMQINDVPAATLAKMRELTQPVAEKFAASYEPATVRIYPEIDKAPAAAR
jgi:TRAP-type C4-dicarboxylate transport system substrate-binding protein